MAKFAPQYNLFKIIDKVKTLITASFIVVLVLSVLPQLVSYIGYAIPFEDLLNVLNIIAIGITFSLEFLVDYILIPQADSKRRDDFLDNSFGSSFSPRSSIDYFDNDTLSYGIFKAATNLFENSYFTYSLAKAVTIRKIVWPTLLMLTVIVCAYYGFRQVPFALSLLQVLFSMSILGDLIKHFILLDRLDDIHDAWILLFQNPDFKKDPDKLAPVVYRYWHQYEALHSRIQAHIPDKVFRALNPRLTQDWEDIKLRYKIN